MINIAIPTFNRKKSLELFFKKNDWIFHSEKIRLFVLDNASTDNTVEFCTGLSAKYNNISLIRGSSHTTAEENVKRAFGLNIKGCLWILGDRYCISKAGVNRLLELIDECENHIYLLSLNNDSCVDENLIVRNPEEIIFKRDIMLAASCLSTAIYSEQARNLAVKMSTANQSPFPHTFVIIQSLKKDIDLKYIPNISVNVIPGKLNWAYTANWVEIGFQGWFNLVDSAYDLDDRKKYLAYKMFPSNTSLGSMRGAIKRRIMGVVNIKNIYADRQTIIKGVGLMKFSFILFISLMPLNIFDKTQKLNKP